MGEPDDRRWESFVSRGPTLVDLGEVFTTVGGLVRSETIRCSLSFSARNRWTSSVKRMMSWLSELLSKPPVGVRGE